jgi:RNA polymerase-associated protein LEO1
MEDEGHYDRDMQPEDVVADEDMRYESDENHELKLKEKPVGPPLDLVVPLKQPPAIPANVSCSHMAYTSKTISPTMHRYC